MLALLFFLTHVPVLNYSGCWADEYFTYNAIRHSIPELTKARIVSGHTPVYFILLHYFCGWTGRGITEITMRLPSVLAGTSAFFTFFLITRRYVKDRRVFLTALLLLLINPYFFWASRDARPYAFVVLLALLSTYILFLDKEKPQRRNLIGYAIIILLGYSIHRLVACMLLPHLCMVLMRDRQDRKRWLRLGLGLIVILALVNTVCFHGFQLRVTQTSKPVKFVWPTPSLLLHRWSALATTSFSPFDGYRAPAWVRPVFRYPAMFATAALLLFACLKHRLLRTEEALEPDTDQYFWRSLVWWILVPSLVLAMVCPRTSMTSLSPRYFFVMHPALLIILAYGFWTTLRGRWQYLVWGVRCVFIVTLCGTLWMQASWQGPGIRESVRYTKQIYEPGDVVFSTWGPQLAFKFYHLLPVTFVAMPAQKMKQEELLKFIDKNAKPGCKAILLVEDKRMDTYSKTLQASSKNLEYMYTMKTSGSYRVVVFRVKP